MTGGTRRPAAGSGAPTYEETLVAWHRARRGPLTVLVAGEARAAESSWRDLGAAVRLLDEESLPDPGDLAARCAALLLVLPVRGFGDPRVEPWKRALSRAALAAARPLAVAAWSSAADERDQLARAFGGYGETMNRLASGFCRVLRDASSIEVGTVEIETGKEQWLAIELCGRPVLVEDDFSDACELETQFPGGEVFVAPREYTAQGSFAVPLRSFGSRRSGSALIDVDDGRIASAAVTGAPRMGQRVLAALGPGEALCEFALGINSSVTADPPRLWTEKAYGTIHLGFGDNTHFGGVHESCVHYDITLERPRIRVDGRAWQPWT